MSEPKKVDRRKFLEAGLAAIALAGIGSAVYFATQPRGVITKTITETAPAKTVTKTVPASPGAVVTETVTETTTVTKTVSPTAAPLPAVTLNYLSETGPEPELVAETFNWYKQAFPDSPITFKPDICDRTVSRMKYMSMLAEKRNDYQLYWCWIQWTRWFVAHEAIEPLENILPSDILEKQKANIPEMLLDFIVLDGKTYDLPIYWNSICLFYRKDLFEDPKEKEAFEKEYGYELRPPRTWKEWIDIAKFFTRPEENLWGTTINGKAWAFYYDEYIYSNWAKLDYVDIKNKKCYINNDYGVKLLETLAELAKISPPGWEEGDWFTFGDPMFAEGKLAMWMNWYYPWPMFQDPTKSKVAGKVGVAPVPTIDETVRPNTTLSGGGVTVFRFATDEQKRAARNYLIWLLSDHVQTAMATTGLLFIPARVDIVQQPAISNFLKAEPFLELVDKQDFAMNDLDTLNYEALWVDGSAEALMKIVRGEMSAKEAADWYADYIIRKLEEAGV